mgnify:CR=1 FL=1
MNKCSQTRISRGFSLIIDDSGQAKKRGALDSEAPGNFTDGVGRQYIGEIGKTDLHKRAKNKNFWNIALKK